MSMSTYLIHSCLTIHQDLIRAIHSRQQEHKMGMNNLNNTQHVGMYLADQYKKTDLFIVHMQPPVDGKSEATMSWGL